MDEDGRLLTFKDFCTKYNLQCDRKLFERVLNAIPKSFIHFVQNASANIPDGPFELPSLLFNGNDLRAMIPNKLIRSCFNSILYPTLRYKNCVLQSYDKQAVKKLRTQYISFPVAPKAKETHFKIFNGVYPSSEFLRQRFNFEENACTFCQVDIETTDHLFFSCVSSNIFWENMSYWLESKIQSLPTFARKHIMFGILLNEKRNEFLVNVMLILGKFFIHKSKCMKTKPYFSVFKKELICNFFPALECGYGYGTRAVKMAEKLNEFCFTLLNLPNLILFNKFKFQYVI